MQNQVLEFMLMADQQCRKLPEMIDDKESNTRLQLLAEEVSELYEAFNNFDLIEVADALGDILYIVLGTANTCGIDIERIFNEIHRSNMTKASGHIDENGKLTKGPEYEPPDIQGVLNSQRSLYK